MKTDKYKILIVEDDEDMLEILAAVLQREGYLAMKAESGRKALDIAKKDEPDLVILDLKLPDCDGIHVLRDLKAGDPDIMVIILTGYGSQEAVRSAMEMGAIDFLTKPLDDHELSSMVREALQYRYVP